MNGRNWHESQSPIMPIDHTWSMRLHLKLAFTPGTILILLTISCHSTAHWHLIRMRCFFVLLSRKEHSLSCGSLSSDTQVSDCNHSNSVAKSFPCSEVSFSISYTASKTSVAKTSLSTIKTPCTINTVNEDCVLFWCCLPLF